MENNFVCRDCGNVFDKEYIGGYSEPVYLCPFCYSENYEMYIHGHLYRVQKESGHRCMLCQRFFPTRFVLSERIGCNTINDGSVLYCFFDRLITNDLTIEEEKQLSVIKEEKKRRWL